MRKLYVLLCTLALLFLVTESTSLLPTACTETLSLTYGGGHEPGEQHPFKPTPPLNPMGKEHYRPKNPLTPVPEPATILLLGSGLIGLVGVSKKRLKK